MRRNIELTHTLYALYMYLPVEKEIVVGKLGSFVFPKGNYVYVGSAKRNIQARIARHLKVKKTLRWHIDYLRECAEVVSVKTYSSNDLSECELLKILKKELHAKILIKKFGSSDCKCVSHLLYVGNNLYDDYGNSH